MSLSLLDLARLIWTALVSLQMYTAGHPRTRETSQALLDSLDEHFRDAPSIKLAIHGDRLFVDDHPAEARSLHVTSLYRIFSERFISGVQLEKGLGLDELTALLEMLLLKPQRLLELGGAEVVFASKNLPHVRLTQTKLTEPPEPLQVKQNEEDEKSRLCRLWLALFKECIQSGASMAAESAWRPLFIGDIPPALLTDAGRLAVELGWGTDAPPPIHSEALRTTLENLSSAEQLSIATGMASLPSAPPSLGKVMEGLIPDILGRAALKLDGDGAVWSGLKERICAALVAKGNVSDTYKAVGTLWLKSGGDPAKVTEIKNRIQWDYLPLNERLIQAEKPRAIWSLSEDQRHALIAQVAESLPRFVFSGLLEKVIDASTNGEPELREKGARTLEYMACDIKTGTIHKDDQAILMQALTTIFGREQVDAIVVIHQKTLQRVISDHIGRGDFPYATTLLLEAEAHCPSDNPNSGAHKALADLKSSLCLRANIEPVVLQYFEHGATFFQDTALPMLKALQPYTVDVLVEMLADEDDRHRRGQIMDTIRALGSDTIPKLLKSLKSNKWYLVRNALVLLDEMADDTCFEGIKDCLRHQDARVKRAAARALWRAFGDRAAAPLLEVIKGADQDVAEEILFGLARIHAPGSAPKVMAYAADTNSPAWLRVMAINVLAASPSPESLPTLAELAKAKEPMEVRLATAKALLAAGKEGKDRLRKLLESEPIGLGRDELGKVLGASRQ